MRKVDPLAADTLTNIFRTSPKDPLRIINREGTTIEFKESYSHGSMAQYFKTIASFANNAGGYIIFGVGNSPRRLLGLKDKNLQQFEELKVEEFTKNLCDYFSPEIKWDHCTFEFKDLSFGVIYTFPLRTKPCICKKVYEAQNTKYSLKEGDIYYRYGGRSERIHYEELNAIMEDARKSEEAQWLSFIKNASKIGIENACLLDLDTGVISGKGGSIVIDNELLSKIAFIKEGEFVEKKGKPALRLIGDIEEVGTGKIIVKESTKKVVKAIEPTDIINAFLKGTKVDEPLEYLRAICSASSANYPFYFLLQQAACTIEDATEMINENTSRGITKKRLLERLQGKRVPILNVSMSQTDASAKKRRYREEWLEENVRTDANEYGYCLSALMSLKREEVDQHEKYIRNKLQKLYSEFYETAKANDATTMRKAICRVDELLYFDE